MDPSESLQRHIDRRKTERSDRHWYYIGALALFLGFFLFAIVVPGWQARDRVRTVVEVLPSYDVKNRDKIEEYFDKAHALAVKSGSKISSAGRKIRLGFDEIAYLERLLVELYRECERTKDADVYQVTWEFQGVVSLLEPSIHKPFPRPEWVIAAKPDPHAQRPVAKVAYAPPPEVRSEPIKLTLNAGVARSQRTLLAPGGRVTLYGNNPENMEPGCYRFASRVKLLGITPGPSGKLDARIELDLGNFEDSQIYLRVWDSNRGKKFCLVHSEAASFADAASGYARQNDTTLCDCYPNSPPQTVTGTEPPRRLGVGSSFEGLESLREKTLKPPPAEEPELPVDRIRQNLGTDAREARKKVEAKREAEKLARQRALEAEYRWRGQHVPRPARVDRNGRVIVGAPP